MSILIKGMKMPVGFTKVEIGYEADGYPMAMVGEDIYDVIPVPEHGRLIDADVVFKRLQKQAMSVWGNGNPRYQIVLEVMDAIRFAPTIIPAEEGEG